MTTVKTNLDQPSAARVPFRPLVNLPASDVQAAITYLLSITGSHQAHSDLLDDLAGLTQAADKGIYFDSATTAATFDLTSFARSILAAGDAATARTLLELVIGTDVQAYSSVLANTTASFTTNDETKLDHITVTQAVDLDALETDVAALSSAVVLKGTWDASSGSFPGSGVAKAGWSYIVSVSGTVDGVAFTANDRIVAIADNASTTTYAANWHKLDYTDQVLSVAGKTGAVTLAVADITDMSANGRSLVSAANYAAMKALLDLEIGTDVQAYSATLAAIAGLATTDSNFIVGNGSSWVAESGATVRTSLGLGSLATASSINNANWSGTDLALANGGTGASLTDPNADRIMFWDDSGGAVTWLQATTGLEIDTTSLRMTANQRTRSIVYVIDGGGATISTGVKGFIEVPFACTITRATALADQSGSIVVDVWKDTYANFPPVNADSITASAPITISGATKSQNTTLSGWTTSISAGDILGFNVDSATSIQRLTIELTVTVT